ncbi:MAG: hypothetical protein RLZZ210_1771 [Pseudomonadota bacterium]|jgi:abortive infection bacteriophage resistance protein
MHYTGAFFFIPSYLMQNTKPHTSCDEQIEILLKRGMHIQDIHYAKQCLTQISYYRLSGFWHICRKIKLDNNQQIILSEKTKKPIRLEEFEQNTNFDEIINLYNFDKKLRLLMLDAIETIEIYLRTIIGNKIGYYSPLAYKKTNFIKPKQLEKINKNGKVTSIWQEFLDKQNNQLKRSKEDYIFWHKKNYSEIPFWVIIETWDFGLLSKYYELLTNEYQNEICNSLEIENRELLTEWLQAINILRNKSAHHSRIWNLYNNNPLKFISNAYFDNLNLDKNASHRIYGLICIINFLLQKICPSNSWIKEVAELINTKPNLPNCYFSSMGINSENELNIK